jgi:hypothetical protein
MGRKKKRAVKALEYLQGDSGDEEWAGGGYK